MESAPLSVHGKNQAEDGEMAWWSHSWYHLITHNSLCNHFLQWWKTQSLRRSIKLFLLFMRACLDVHMCFPITKPPNALAASSGTLAERHPVIMYFFRWWLWLNTRWNYWNGASRVCGLQSNKQLPPELSWTVLKTIHQSLSNRK